MSGESVEERGGSLRILGPGVRGLKYDMNVRE